MTVETRAVIDIGTNSVKLLIGSSDGQSVRPLAERSIQTRLGRGFYESHILQRAPLAETADAVAEFAREARSAGCKRIRVIATSAARDAKNPDDLVEAVRKASDLKIEIISGEEEAALVYAGVSSAPGLGTIPLLVFDIGGGSTELIFGCKGQKLVDQSFRVGSVRLLEAVPVEDPPTRRNWTDCDAWLEKYFVPGLLDLVRPMLQDGFHNDSRLIGTGGTPSILARMHQKLSAFDRDKIEATVLTVDDVSQHRERMWTLPIALRRKLAGLPSDRADVILTGVAILECMMKMLEFRELRISTRGLRFGALLGRPQP